MGRTAGRHFLPSLLVFIPPAHRARLLGGGEGGRMAQALPRRTCVLLAAVALAAARSAAGEECSTCEVRCARCGADARPRGPPRRERRCIHRSRRGAASLRSVGRGAAGSLGDALDEGAPHQAPASTAWGCPVRAAVLCCACCASLCACRRGANGRWRGCATGGLIIRSGAHLGWLASNVPWALPCFGVPGVRFLLF